MKKKIVSFCLILVLSVTCLNLLGISSVNAAEINNTYLQQYTISFLDLVDEEKENEFETDSVDTIYTLDENIYGYKVNFTNINNEEKGYINYNKDGAVIEYCYNSEGTAFDEYKDSKIYYNGDLEYYFEKPNKKLVSIFDGKEKTKSNIKVEKPVKVENNIEFNIPMGKSTPAGSGQYIYSPSSFLTNIHSTYTENIPGYWQTYVSTSNYTSSDWTGLHNHCGPTAAVNMLIWFDNNNYPALITGQSHPYSDTFTEICDLMDFSNLFSTPQQVINGVYDYFHDVYTTDSWNKYTDYYVTRNDAKGRVAQDIPSIYCVCGHSLYGSHFVVIVGYQEIVTWWKNIFGVKCYSTHLFMKIADGWGAKYNGVYKCYANRYINYDDANTRYMCWLA